MSSTRIQLSRVKFPSFSSISNLLMNLSPSTHKLVHLIMIISTCVSVAGQSKVHSQNAPKCERNWDDSGPKEEGIAFASGWKILIFASNKYFNSENDFMNLSLTQMHSREITLVRQTNGDGGIWVKCASWHQTTVDEWSELWASRLFWGVTDRAQLLQHHRHSLLLSSVAACGWDVKIPIRLDSPFQVR